MANFYKPKYKLNYTMKTKILPYKNSRLSKFYDRRGNITFRKGFWHRQYLKLNSQKWRSIKRILSPKKRKNRFQKKFKFRSDIDNIKRIIKFYGKFNAHSFKQLFYKSYRNKHLNKMQSFIYNLEQRADIVLFRLKFLPTIYACHYFIKSKGILVNKKLITHPHTKINIGDFISVSKDVWFYFFYIFEKKILNRLIRTFSFYKRKKNIFKKLKIEYKRSKYYRIRKFNNQTKESLKFSKGNVYLNNFALNLKKRKKNKWWSILLNKNKQMKIRGLFFWKRLKHVNHLFYYKDLKKRKIKKFKKHILFNFELKQKFLYFKLKKLKLIKTLNRIKKYLVIINKYIKNLNIIKQNKNILLFYIQIIFKFKQLKNHILIKNKYKENKWLVFNNILKKKLFQYIFNILLQKKNFSINEWKVIFNKLVKNKVFLIKILLQIKKLWNKKHYILSSTKTNKFNKIFNVLYKSKTNNLSISNNKKLIIKQNLNNKFKLLLTYWLANNLENKKNLTYTKHLNIVEYNKVKNNKFYTNINTLINYTNDFFYIKKNIFYLYSLIQYLSIILDVKYKQKKFSQLITLLINNWRSYSKTSINFVNNNENNVKDFNKNLKLCWKSIIQSNKNSFEFLNINLKNFDSFLQICLKNSNSLIKTGPKNLQPILIEYNKINNKLKQKLTIEEQKECYDIMFNYSIALFIYFYQYELNKFKNVQFNVLNKKIKRGNIFHKKILKLLFLKRFAKNWLFKKHFYFFAKSIYSKKNWQYRKFKRQQMKLSKIKRRLLNQHWRQQYKAKSLNFYKKPHWFIPQYMEFDFVTLRGGLIRKPTLNEIVYPFNFSIKQVITFYKERGF